MARKRRASIGWLAVLRPRVLRKPSVVVLILANLVPLAGVLLWKWDLFGLMLLYWMETGIIGLFAIIHMAIVARWGALFLVPFFCVHFGGFMLGHLFFLVIMFGGARTTDIAHLQDLVLKQIDDAGVWIALAALCVSHGVSFVLNLKRSFQPQPLARHATVVPAPPDPTSLMVAPYGRVVIMHLTIIFGAILAQKLGSNAAAFALLIVLKTAVDLAAHVRKNFRD
jgi:hypothetical protein